MYVAFIFFSLFVLFSLFDCIYFVLALASVSFRRRAEAEIVTLGNHLADDFHAFGDVHHIVFGRQVPAVLNVLILTVAKVHNFRFANL